MFEITITKTTTERRTLPPKWELTGKDGEAVYGYTPEVPADVPVTLKILTQTVEDLDLPAVIKAINRI